MYVKVFSQILESSISVDYEQRHIFMDLLILADREGVIDMTQEAIARRLNVPEGLVSDNIAKLEQPDPKSRSEEHEGRRLVRLADHRDWGWQVVNYGFYRDLVDAETLRIANRERKREQRAKERAARLRLSNAVLDCHTTSQIVRDSHNGSQKVTLSDADTEAEAERIEKDKSFSLSALPPKKQSKSKPSGYEELRQFVTERLRLTEDDAVSLYEHWEGNGYKVNKVPMANWKATASCWKRRGIFFPSIQSANFGFSKK
jgi:hypothetical protein